MSGSPGTPPTTIVRHRVGRYVLLEEFAAGGMATVHYGCMTGSQGFRRIVAIKRMRPGLLDEAAARETLVDEGRVAARVQHVNVVQTIDVVADGKELLLVLEYVIGESLDRLVKAAATLKQRIPRDVVAALIAGSLRGLHAAHQARGTDGMPLELVHRDVSPHNIIVDASGVPRVADFGIAKARGRLQNATQTGQLKGKLAYVAPEQIHGDSSPASDVFSTGVVLWECLSLSRLFKGKSEAEVLTSVLQCEVPDIPGADPQLLLIARTALSRLPQHRYGTALVMAEAIEATGIASPSEVAAWLRGLVSETLDARQARVRALELEPLEDPPQRRPPRRGGSALLVAGGLTLLASGGAAWWAAAKRAADPGPVATGVLDAGRAPAPLPDHDNAMAAPVALTPEITDAGLALPATAGVFTTEASELHDAGPPVVTGPLRKKAGRPRADCSVPWVIDANGRKRYKLECL